MVYLQKWTWVICVHLSSLHNWIYIEFCISFSCLSNSIFSHIFFYYWRLSLPTHVLPMWAYVHRDPMGSWQMARHCHTQMPTSYLSHLCQDKTHEVGMESNIWGNKIWGETLKQCKAVVCLISRISYRHCCHVWYSTMQLFLCVKVLLRKIDLKV